MLLRPIGESNYTCICVVKLNCKKAISAYHDKTCVCTLVCTVESLTIIRDRVVTPDVTVIT